MASHPVSYPITGDRFSLLNLPPELRNLVYGHLLTNNRDPDKGNLFINDILRRKHIRALPDAKRNWKSLGIARHWGIYNESSPVQKQRNEVPLENIPLNAPPRRGEYLPRKPLPPLLDTVILRVCRQTEDEGLHMMYSKHIISIIIKTCNSQLEPIETRFSATLEFPRITTLRTEIQFRADDKGDLPSKEHVVAINPHTTFSFTNMPSLRSLQLYVTFAKENRPMQAARFADEFNRSWRSIPRYLGPMRELLVAIAALPEGVNVLWGVTEEQEQREDFGGQACVAKDALMDIRDANLADLAEGRRERGPTARM